MRGEYIPAAELPGIVVCKMSNQERHLYAVPVDLLNVVEKVAGGIRRSIEHIKAGVLVREDIKLLRFADLPTSRTEREKWGTRTQSSC